MQTEEVENFIVKSIFTDDEESDDDFEQDFDEFFEECDSDTSSSSMDTTDSSVSSNAEPKSGSRMKNYITTVIYLFDDKQFQTHFRMSRRSCYYFVNKINEAQILPTHSFGRQKVVAEKAILMTVWYLANTETYRQISDRFDVARGTAHSVIRIVVKYLVSLSPHFISWPNAEESTIIAKNFSEKQGIQKVIGAIDGTHVIINRPPLDAYAYCNRKGDHSIILQVICNHKKQFIDVFCGEAGSLHDARVLKKSNIYNICQKGFLDKQDLFILGDSAYPNLKWLVTPYKDNGFLTSNQREFNYKHSSTRIIIENAIGLLKGRFRRLLHFYNRNINFIVESTIASCVLHNVCILQKDDTAVEEIFDNFDNCVLFEEQNKHETSDINNRREELFNIMFSNL